jgi:HPt (histidine-containing phosphotransfer) domain-containing protein
VLGEWAQPPRPAGTDDAGAAIDPAVLGRLRVGLDDDEVLAEIVALYSTDAASRVAELELALAAGDAEGLVRTAHTLKGSSSNVGATQVTLLAQRLGDEALDGESDEMHLLVDRLRDEVTRAASALRADLAAAV